MSTRELHSIRVGKLHFPVDRLDPDDHKSVNKAKRHSRSLGGARYVRVVESAAEAKAILKELQS